MVASPPPQQQQRRRLRRLSHHLAPAGSATDAAALGGGRWAGHDDPSRRFPSTAATNDPAVATERLRRDGFVVVKGMLTEADAARHRTELSAHMADIDAVLADAERGGRGEASRGANNRMEALKSYFPEALGLPGVGNYGITGYIRFAPEWAEIGDRHGAKHCNRRHHRHDGRGLLIQPCVYHRVPQNPGLGRDVGTVLPHRRPGHLPVW